MKNTLRILLIEDDTDSCRKYIDCVEHFEDITLVSVTNDSEKALQDTKDYLPHAIILDLELHNGRGSGLDVLNGLKDLNLDFIPYILISTNNTSSVTHEFARKLGADYIFSKHQSDYSEQRILEFLKLMKEAIQSKCTVSPGHTITPETCAQRKQRILRRISSELNQVGISPKAIGRQYLTDAILLVIEEPRQGLSSIIAQKYEKSNSSVERAMQNAINKAWRTTDIEELLLHFEAKINSERGVPTITEFVYYYADKLRDEY